MMWNTIRKFKFLLPVLGLILSFLLPACEKETAEEEISLEVLKPTMVTETSFQLNWTINGSNFHSIVIDLSLDRDFNEIEESISLTDVELENYLFQNKRGASNYFYRISLMGDGGKLVVSDLYSVETSYVSEALSFETSDGMTLKGSIAYLESNSTAKPGVIMMHELGVWVNPWIGSDLLKELVSEGYVCVTFFFRGHGNSSDIEGGFMKLVDDKGLIAKDLDAAITFTKAHEMVDAKKLGLVGASLGGIMALAGNGYPEVKTSVSLSAPADGVYQIFPNMILSSVYLLAGELDRSDVAGVDFARDAELLYKSAGEPKKLTIVPGTTDHGTSLLSRDELNMSILEWMLEILPVN